MHLHVYVKRPEAFIGIGRYIKRLIIIIIIIIIIIQQCIFILNCLKNFEYDTKYTN